MSGMNFIDVKKAMKLNLRTNGYSWPIEFWGKVAKNGLRVKEIPIPMIYHEEDYALDVDESDKLLLATEFMSTMIETHMHYYGQQYSESKDQLITDIGKNAEKFGWLLRKKDFRLIYETLDHFS
jgi:hypothetical protein